MVPHPSPTEHSYYQQQSFSVVTWLFRDKSATEERKGLDVPVRNGFAGNVILHFSIFFCKECNSAVQSSILELAYVRRDIKNG
jgi:hypothetical protein